MKKLLLLLTLSWFMVGCAVSVTEAQIVGTYTCDETKHIDEDNNTNAVDISLSTTTTYRADRTFSSQGTMRFGVSVNEDGYRNYITLIYDISHTGNWSLVDGNKLFEQSPMDNVSIKYQDLKLKKRDEEGLAAAVFIMVGMSSGIEALQADLADGITSNILSFSDRKMVLEDVDDGTKVDYIRTK